MAMDCIQRHLRRMRLLRISLLLMATGFGLGFAGLKLLALIILIMGSFLWIVVTVLLMLRL